MAIDVTDAVQQAKGREIGFRIKLQIDPDGPCVNFAGSGFNGLFNNPPTLEIEFGHAQGSPN